MLSADLYATAADGLVALGYTPEEEPKWDKDFGAILIGENGALLARADPREETTALGK